MNQDGVVQRIHHADGRIEEITGPDVIVIYPTPAQRAEMIAALRKQEAEKEAARWERNYQDSIELVKQLHRQMVKREIDDVARRLLESVYAGGETPCATDDN
jgi:hypothetical protein